MLMRMKTYGLSLAITLAFLLLTSQISFAQPDACMPSCSAVDGRFLVIAGTDLSTIVGAEIVVNLVSRGDTLEFGIFDGEAGENWDTYTSQASRLHLKFELHADPAGDSSGLAGPVIASWTGDGSGPALNAGRPMNNNDWSDFTFLNVPEAQAPNGNYVYTLRITPIDPGLLGNSESVFKVRTSDDLYIPAMFPVSFIGPLGAKESIFTAIEDIMIIFPNAFFDAGSVCGIPGGCDPNDPDCCLHETTYDGSWSFFMNVPEGEDAIDVWDGDFDFGDELGTVFDTDDPNTPGDPFIPTWSMGTDVVFEGAAGSDPPDDFDTATFILRSPSINYLVIDPLGNQYINDNPSGNTEWELFRMDTATSDPAITDVQVQSIPPGQWEVRLIGLDLSNLNALVLPFDLRTVRQDEPAEPSAVPTLNEWGLITLSAIVLLISIYYLRIRERKVSS